MLERLTGHLRLREKALDAAWTRNEVIAQNIANVDTPAYKGRIVTFEEHLDKAMDKDGFKGFTTDNRHIQIGGGSLENAKIKITREHKNLSVRIDGNNVDIESEMASLAKNNIRYSTLTQSISSGYRRIKSVISGGR